MTFNNIISVVILLACIANIHSRSDSFQEYTSSKSHHSSKQNNVQFSTCHAEITRIALTLSEMIILSANEDDLSQAYNKFEILNLSLQSAINTCSASTQSYDNDCVQEFNLLIPQFNSAINAYNTKNTFMLAAEFTQNAESIQKMLLTCSNTSNKRALLFKNGEFIFNENENSTQTQQQLTNDNTVEQCVSTIAETYWSFGPIITGKESGRTLEMIQFLAYFGSNGIMSFVNCNGISIGEIIAYSFSLLPDEFKNCLGTSEHLFVSLVHLLGDLEDFQIEEVLGDVIDLLTNLSSDITYCGQLLHTADGINDYSFYEILDIPNTAEFCMEKIEELHSHIIQLDDDMSLDRTWAITADVLNLVGDATGLILSCSGVNETDFEEYIISILPQNATICYTGLGKIKKDFANLKLSFSSGPIKILQSALKLTGDCQTYIPACECTLNDIVGTNINSTKTAILFGDINKAIKTAIFNVPIPPAKVTPQGCWNKIDNLYHNVATGWSDFITLNMLGAFNSLALLGDGYVAYKWNCENITKVDLVEYQIGRLSPGLIDCINEVQVEIDTVIKLIQDIGNPIKFAKDIEELKKNAQLIESICIPAIDADLLGLDIDY